MRRTTTFLALLSMLAISCGDPPIEKENVETVQPDAGNQVTVSANELNVLDQALDERFPYLINIDRVAAEQYSFLVIDTWDDGMRLENLAIVPIEAGVQEDLQVDLIRDISGPETLVASLHVDANQDGSYQAAEGASGDFIALDEAGDPLEVTFSVVVERIDPNLQISDQDAPDRFTLNIDNVSTPEPGFLLIFKRKEVQGFTDLFLADGGVIPLERGSYDNYEVVLEEALLDGETHRATLVYDSNGNGEYDGQQVDTAALDAAGERISVDFLVNLPADPTITVSRQVVDPANEVVIDRIDTYEPGYVAIVGEDDEFAVDFANPIGWVAHDAGVTENLRIVTDRPLDVSGYYAVLFQEQGGDPNALDPGIDTPVMSFENPELEIFESLLIDSIGTSKPFLDMGDQIVFPSAPREHYATEIIVGEVAWLVISDSDGAGGKGPNTLGVAQVNPGISSPLILLNRDADQREDMYAELYIDDGDGTYDSGDQPATRDGEVLAESYTSFPYANNIAVSDQALTDVSTRITIDGYEIIDGGAGYIVIHDGSDTVLGEVLATVPTTVGASTMPETALVSRPLSDGETLRAWLYEEAGGAGFDPNNDRRLDGFGEPLSQAFTVSVGDDVPAARIEVGANGSIAYLMRSVDPPEFFDQIVDGNSATSDPPITLKTGWRYTFDLGSSATSHPIEFGVGGGGDTTPEWPLAMGGGGDTLESDAGINWTETATAVSFTVTSDFAQRVDTYRCQTHESMSGTVIVE